jgi:hypothetical protein
MHALTRTSDGRFRRLTQQTAKLRRRAAERREHDEIMRDPRMAAEHVAAASRATTDGRPGCAFCT